MKMALTLFPWRRECYTAMSLVQKQPCLWSKASIPMDDVRFWRQVLAAVGPGNSSNVVMLLRSVIGQYCPFKKPLPSSVKLAMQAMRLCTSYLKEMRVISHHSHAPCSRLFYSKNAFLCKDAIGRKKDTCLEFILIQQKLMICCR